MKIWRPEEGDDFDTTIDAEWRKASREEPRPHVDAAILAAARTRRPRFATWQPLAAAAAIAGLAFLLVQSLPREHARSAPESAPGLQQEPADAEASRSDAESGPRQLAKESQASVEPAAGVPAPAARPHARAAAAPAPAAAAERAAAAAESSSLAAPTSQIPPEQWATLIETLHASGDLAAAAAQLRTFRTQHADADRYLPEAVRAWASAVE